MAGKKIDRRPLLAYMRVQEAWELDLLKILSRAAEQASRDIRRLTKTNGIGAAVRADQLSITRAALLRRQAELWRLIGSSVEAGRKEAAAAAVDSAATYDAVLLRQVLTPGELEALQASARAQAQRGIDHVISRALGLSDIPLSERVYKTQALSNNMVGRLIENAIARGVSARDLANEVKDLIDPKVKGGVQYAAKRLGRTELNNAFHATQVRQAQNKPWITGMKWNLSGSHTRPDECDSYEGTVFAPSDVPSKPHPQCFCYLTPETPEPKDFVAAYLRGEYGRIG